ncbi:MAG TPA: exodeoxyribonuclease VII small subunit [Nitrospiria bacterium]|nr:exodeoxyribonuclease VII small subunit [Nitrospiria bacterium]
MSKKHESKSKSSPKFEESLKRLEAIVSRLEKGELPLDESVKIFEEGIRLSKNCMKTLEEAERKVEILLEDKNGKKKTRPFPAADEEEAEDEEDR